MKKKANGGEPLRTDHDGPGDTAPREAVIYLEGPAAGEVVKVLAVFPRDRTVRVNGVNYEHVADTPAGEWIYRAM